MKGAVSETLVFRLRCLICGEAFDSEGFSKVCDECFMTLTGAVEGDGAGE